MIENTVTQLMAHIQRDDQSVGHTFGPRLERTGLIKNLGLQRTGSYLKIIRST